MHQQISRIQALLDLLGRTNVGLQERYDTGFATKRTLLGSKTVRTRTAIEPAWPVGNLPWKIGESHTRGESTDQMPSGVTKSMQIVMMSPETGRELQVWSTRLASGPLAHDGVRDQVLTALERLAQRI